MVNLKNQALFKQQNYINGIWVNAKSNNTLDVFNPFNNEKIGTIPNSGIDETKAAINAANSAFKLWKSKTAQERSTIINRWATLIDENKEDLAKIMTVEQGKPLTEAIGEINYGNSFNKWFAEEAKRIYGDVIPTNNNDRRLIVIKEPIGVCAAITPWNFPNAMITRKCAPALASGCTLVIKPSELTPFSAFALMELATQAGFPAGVINMVTGDAKLIGEEMCKNKLVKKLSFTGSTRVGKLLMQQCSDSLKKISLELGGNAPFIIFEDADIKASVDGVLAAKFRNSGQTCVSANRVYVHEKIYVQFVTELTNHVKKLQVGNGLDSEINVGPLINQAGIEKVERLINDAVSHGAKIICGGKRHTSSVNAYEPTIVEDVSETMSSISCEEIFGPVIALYRFNDERDVINRANNTPYGLAAYFYSRDISKVWRVAEELEFGIISINKGIFSTEAAPFGGMKESGFGREGSKYGIDDFIQVKYLCMGIN